MPLSYADHKRIAVLSSVGRGGRSRAEPSRVRIVSFEAADKKFMPEFFGKRRNNFVQRVRNAYGYAFGMFVVVAEEFSAVEYVGAQFAVAPVVIQ